MAQVHVNVAALNRFLTRVVQPYLMSKANEVAEEARRRAPVGATGDLKSSISVEPGAGGGAKVRVNAPHAGFVHEGTGLQHQPARSPYYPRLRKRGLLLWADSKSANPYKVAHGISINGTPANPFLTEAIDHVLGRFHLRWIKRDITEL